MVVVAAVSCWLAFSASLALAWAPVDDLVVVVAAAAPALQLVAVAALAQILRLATPVASFLKPPSAPPTG